MTTSWKKAESFRYLVLAVQRYGNKLLKMQLSELGITPSQAEVLSILKHSPKISLKHLGELLICEEGSPSRLVNRMVTDGLIERIKGKEDGRYVSLILTQKAEQIYEKVCRAEQVMYAEILNTYSKDEIEVCNKMLARILIDTEYEGAFRMRDIEL